MEADLRVIPSDIKGTCDAVLRVQGLTITCDLTPHHPYGTHHYNDGDAEFFWAFTV